MYWRFGERAINQIKELFSREPQLPRHCCQQGVTNFLFAVAYLRIDGRLLAIDPQVKEGMVFFLAAETLLEQARADLLGRLRHGRRSPGADKRDQLVTQLLCKGIQVFWLFRAMCR